MMKKGKKTALLVSGIAVAAGLVLAAAGLALMGGDLTVLDTETLDHHTHPIYGSVNNIDIQTVDSNITLLPSPDGSCSVLCTESERRPHQVSLDNGTLTIRQTGSTVSYFGIWSEEPEVTVYLPEAHLQTLKLRSSSGDITVRKEFTFRSARLETASGTVRFSGNVSENLEVDTSSGDVLLTGCQVGGNARVKTVSGSQTLSRLSATALETGSSSGELLLENLTLRSVTGETTSAGITITGCEVEEDISLDTSSGDMTLLDSGCGGSLRLETTSGVSTLGSIRASRLSGQSSSGTIRLTDVVVEEEIGLNTVSGAVALEASDADTLVICTSSGDVTGTLRTVKNFMTSTSSGEVRISDSDSHASPCRITTTSGDIVLTISPAE